MMEYKIQPPDNVIEASFSTDPDDINVVSIRIKATASDPNADPPQIRFTVPTTLTTNPSSITPQAGNFAAWEMVVEGGGRFRAIPRVPQPAGSEWLFFLRDIEVAVGVGETHVTVEETPARAFDPEEPARAYDPEELSIRKVHPSLRIDHFRVVDDQEEPLDASTTSTQSVLLDWATTAAKTVSLFGPKIDGLEPKGGILPVDDHDDTRKISPDTTSVYTLVATSAQAHVVAQVTVTVTDQMVFLGPMTAESLTATGDVNDQHGPVIPVGLIAMWSGSPTDIPSGWALCDGTDVGDFTTPDLSGRFIVGYSEDDSDFSAIKNTGGAKTVTLETEHLPSHAHDVEAVGNHHHKYTPLDIIPGERPFATVINQQLETVIGSQDGIANSTTFAGGHDHDLTATGGGEAHPNLPPYFVLAFIIRVPSATPATSEE